MNSAKPVPSDDLGTFTPRYKPDGAIIFALSVSHDEDGKKTIHMDAFGDSAPYGHISMKDARCLRDWLNKALTL